MKKFIICNTEKEDDEFNSEHVIPESEGSSFMTFVFQSLKSYNHSIV